MNFGGFSPVGVLFILAPLLGAVAGVRVATHIVRTQAIQSALRTLSAMAILGGAFGLIAPAPRALPMNNTMEFVFLVWWGVALISALILAGAAIAGGLGGAIRFRQASLLLPAVLGLLAVYIMIVATATELIWPYARA
jgi:hypothetical protein